MAKAFVRDTIHGRMKNHTLTLLMALGTFLFAIPQASHAHAGQWDSREHYYVDTTGYWDENDQHQKFITNHHHLGYWDTRSNHGIFIIVAE